MKEFLLGLFMGVFSIVFLTTVPELLFPSAKDEPVKVITKDQVGISDYAIVFDSTGKAIDTLYYTVDTIAVVPMRFDTVSMGLPEYNQEKN